MHAIYSCDYPISAYDLYTTDLDFGMPPGRGDDTWVKWKVHKKLYNDLGAKDYVETILTYRLHTFKPLGDKLANVFYDYEDEQGGIFWPPGRG